MLSLSQLIAEPPKMSEYQTYIDFERKEGDPARILIIFERALAENCLVPDLWAKYTSYLVSKRQWLCDFNRISFIVRSFPSG